MSTLLERVVEKAVDRYAAASNPIRMFCREHPELPVNDVYTDVELFRREGPFGYVQRRKVHTSILFALLTALAEQYRWPNK